MRLKYGVRTPPTDLSAAVNRFRRRCAGPSERPQLGGEAFLSLASTDEDRRGGGRAGARRLRGCRLVSLGHGPDHTLCAGACYGLGMTDDPGATEHPTYVTRALNLLARELPDVDADLLRFYAVLMLTFADDVTSMDVHDAWAVWRHTTEPDHPWVGGYGELAPEALDFHGRTADIIRKVATAFSDGAA
jgi:hypothetical protein